MGRCPWPSRCQAHLPLKVAAASGRPGAKAGLLCIEWLMKLLSKKKGHCGSKFPRLVVRGAAWRCQPRLARAAGREPPPP